MGAKIDNLYKYAAFISYAHADEAVAKKLHVALETYPLPKGMDKAERDKLFPVFRDVTELTAHHSLSEKIRDAVKTSRFLIVLCSPASKKSHWVNEEIKLFRKLHGEGSILAVIVDGVPDTAFPPALTADGREPLAANMATNEGFRFGVTQLAASMLGVGLDTLVQRDQKRRRMRTQVVTAATTTLAVVMGALAWTAVDARDDAEVAQAKAEVSRDAAEEMVEFMIGDLKNDLTPIQKLDLFDGIGKRVADYYDAIPLEDMDDDRMMRRARALHVLGEVEINRGNYEKAAEILQAAYQISEDVYARNPENTDAIFAHAQSEFWMGWSKFKQRNFEDSLKGLGNYRTLGFRLYSINPNNPSYIAEAAAGALNYGTANLRLENFERAESTYKNAENYLKTLLELDPKDKGIKFELANLYSGLAQVESGLGNQANRIEYSSKSTEIYRKLWASDKKDFQKRYRYLQAKYKLLRASKVDLCNNGEAIQSFENITDLTNYDPENFQWRKEFFSQWENLLTDCHGKNLAILNTFTAKRFFQETSKHEIDKTVLRMRERVRKSIKGAH